MGSNNAAREIAQPVRRLALRSTLNHHRDLRQLHLGTRGRVRSDLTEMIELHRHQTVLKTTHRVSMTFEPFSATSEMS